MQFQVMAKPTGSRCNLNCSYCFYLEKEHLYQDAVSSRMCPEVLASYIRQSIESQEKPPYHFAWQGGEPTLLGVAYFKLVVELQKKYAGGQKVSNSIQTNGTLLTDSWCVFLKKHDFLVGISIDGPRELHDNYRIKGNGRSTFDAVMSGINLLKEYNIPFNTLTVVNDVNSQQPLKVYEFLKSIGDGHMQFIPAVERMPNENNSDFGFNLAAPPFKGELSEEYQLMPWSVKPDALATFYIAIFHHWIRHDVGSVFVQLFEVALGNWLGAGSGLCQFSEKCGTAGALEHNGDLYCCDHYVYPQHKLGNILETPLLDLMQSDKQQSFGNAKLTSLAKSCIECKVRSACHGDCPKHRFIKSSDGEPGVSYLCSAYKNIFTHMGPYLHVLADLMQSGRATSDIMKMFQYR